MQWKYLHRWYLFEASFDLIFDSKYQKFSTGYFDILGTNTIHTYT